MKPLSDSELNCVSGGTPPSGGTTSGVNIVAPCAAAGGYIGTLIGGPVGGTVGFVAGSVVGFVALGIRAISKS